MPVGKCAKCGGPIYKTKGANGTWKHLRPGQSHKAAR